ncbi:MAG: magnesium chelatase subunit D family protein [Elusimicrobiota bacterium]
MHHKHVIYPFTAIVGQEQMKKTLILNAIDWQIGGVLIRGEKGTAKSTAARALADLLPEIEVVKNCPFSCNPHNIREMCKLCQELMKSEKNLPVKKRKMIVVDLPINATEDRVSGTLNIEKAIREGIKALEPGILADANRGILYIDEVNLLDDHIADLLLDAAAMGVNTVEREGISVYHPSKFILIGTMNPEEGELRPQLIDRFGLSVKVDKIVDIEQRKQIMKLREKFDFDHWQFIEQFKNDQIELCQKIEKARSILSEVNIHEDLLTKIAQVCIDFAVDGHRADIITVKCAKAIASFDGRDKVTEEDVMEALKFTLPHRMRRKPFEKLELDSEKLKNYFNQQRKQTPENNQKSSFDSEQNLPKEEIFSIGKMIETDKLLEKDKDRIFRTSTGKSNPTFTEGKQGKQVRTKTPDSKPQDIAIDATIRAAALHYEPGDKFTIEPEDIREKVRMCECANLITFVVDASGSMGVEERMKSAKGAVLSLLNDAYQKRDKVAMVAFRNDESYILLPPTRSVDMALKYLEELPTGGKTPLPSGILKGIDVIKNELIKNDNLIPVLVLITDGKGNVPIRNDVLEDLSECAEEIKRKKIHIIVIDTETGFPRLGLAKQFAVESNAKYYYLDELQEKRITSIIKSEMEEVNFK